jgi:pimeloyl-ACP methyl ester carboxylesterase
MTFDSHAQLIRRDEFEQLASLDAPDLVLLAHGWLNDRRRATEMFDYFRAQLAPIPVHGIYWPSKPGASQGVIAAGAENASYYRMKARAGDVGALGLAPCLELLHERKPALRLHLAGHSFGARLVTAAVSALPPGIVHSLTLIQAAFSQFAFEPAGAFHNVVEPRRLAGPILITHSHRDQAVGFAYPIASRLARQNASTLGGKSDPYGGLGRNGAPHAHTVPLDDLDHIRAHLAAPLLNLESSAIIRSHTDINHPAVAAAIRAAVQS